MARIHFASVLSAAVLAAGSVTAQFDREMDVPTDRRTFFGFSVSGIDTLVHQGYRLTDIEVVSATANSTVFSGTAVRDAGAYDTGWWWYYGVTPLDLLSYANQHGARLIDVERYTVGNSIRYAGIMVSNPGPNPIQWYLWPEVQYGDVANLLSTANARLIDVDHHEVNGQDRLTLLAVRNTGAHARTWWYYIDTTLPYIESKIAQHQARPIDLERIGPNRWAAILVDDAVGHWWYYHGVSAADVLDRESHHLARAIDVERYLDNGTPRYLALMVDNFENFRSYGSPCATAGGLLQHDVPLGTGFGGGTTYYRARNLTPGSIMVMALGAQQTAIDLGFLGAPGCSLYTQPLVTIQSGVGASGQVAVPLGIPDAPELIGQRVFTQFVSFDRSNVAAPLATSNGIETTIRD